MVLLAIDLISSNRNMPEDILQQNSLIERLQFQGVDEGHTEADREVFRSHLLSHEQILIGFVHNRRIVWI